MKTTDLLANVRVASPCPANWTEMLGDDRARFCAHCEKHVYNLSNLTADEATALILEKEGDLCARFYQRADGTVLTADCPVGANRILKRMRWLVGAAASLVAVSFAIPIAVTEASESPEIRPKLYRTWDSAVIKVKTWLGLQPPPMPMTMGVICTLPANPKPAPAPRSSSAPKPDNSRQNP